jgi:monoterpene epsilon-lactone hydrolase
MFSCMFTAAPGSSAAALIAAKDGIPVVSTDCRRAAEFPHPAATDDVVAVWIELLKTHSPSQMALFGTSAGGNLTLVATLRLKDLGLRCRPPSCSGRPPSTWTRPTKAGSSTTASITASPGTAMRPKRRRSTPMGTIYTEPYLSLMLGDVSGFPPAYLVTGIRDLCSATRPSSTPSFAAPVSGPVCTSIRLPQRRLSELLRHAGERSRISPNSARC